MPDYRLYFLDRAGHIEGRKDIAALDDEEAIAEALREHDSNAMELWQGARVVKRFPAKGLLG